MTAQKTIDKPILLTRIINIQYSKHSNK